MHDDILKKLEGRLDRRSFLRGSGLFAAAALTGIAAFPVSASAQDPAPKKDEPKKDEPKKEDKPAEEGKKEDAPKPENKDDKKEEDPFKVTRKDDKGRDYRLCPQCGYNMYKQDRTWSCENCGYSYTE